MNDQLPAQQSTDIGRWYVMTGALEYGADAWSAAAGTALTMQLPDGGTRELRVEIELGAGGQVHLDIGTARLAVDGGAARSVTFTPAGGDMSYVYACPALAEGGALVLRATPAGYAVTFNGAELITCPNAFPERDIVALLLHLPAVWRGPAPRVAWGVPGAAFVQKPLRGALDFHITIDFYDDLIRAAAPYTPRAFDNLMEFHAAHGVRRIYWIYCGEDRHGWWDNMDLNQARFPGLLDKVRETRRNVPDWQAQAVASAHKHGMEFYSIIKPFDMGIGAAFLPPDAPARQRRARVMGGWSHWTTDLIVSHPELREERFLAGMDPEDSRAIAMIRLVKDDARDTAVLPDQLELHVSDDNHDYRRYTGPLDVSVALEYLPGLSRAPTPANVQLLDPPMPRRVITLRVNVPQKYLVICAGRGCSFGNRLHRLVELRDAAGQPVPFEYGLGTFSRQPGDFAGGVVFCVPGALPAGAGDLAFLDNAGGFLGLARGKERYITGYPFIGYPAVEQYMFQLMEECLAAGVDGIDWRDGNHNRSFEWEAYGFQTPVRDAFRARHGLDINTDKFRLEDLRRVRGAFYTDFLRKTRARLRAAGKAQQAHISPHFTACDPRGRLRITNEIFLDWPTWLAEDLLDGITLKIHEGLRPVADSQRAVIAAAHARGVPVYACHYLNGTVARSGRANRYRGLLASYRNEGLDGHILYENAEMLQLRADGSFANLAPDYFDLARG